MGKTVITIEAWHAPDVVVAAAREAVAGIRAKGISVLQATAVYHPGQPDEQTTDVLNPPAE